MKKSMSKIKSQLGLSVIELLVAMTIGLIILAGVITFMGDSKNQYLMEQEISYIQENIRFASDQISHDIRMSGYFGCARDDDNLTNTLIGSTSPSNWHIRSQGIKGFEIGDANYPTQYSADVLAGTDTVVVNWGEPDDSIQVTSHNPSAATFQMASATGVAPGDVLVVASPTCRSMAIFQKTEPASSSSNIEHKTGIAGISPGNCHTALSETNDLFNPLGYDCSSVPGGNGITYGPGSMVMRFHSSAFFLKNSPRTGLPSLFKQTLLVSGGALSTQAQELVSGVEDMEIIYGVDTDVTADGEANRYYHANQITVDNVTAAPWVGWNRVVSARVTLIVRSSRQVYFENTTVDLGDGDTFNDRFMRQKASFTVQIRNSGLGT